MLKKRQKHEKPKRVLMALSGGIDSAVSSYLLLKAGYHVEAAFMKNWSSTAGLKLSECPWLQDRQDALRVAAFFRIPLHTLDFEKQYAKTVMDYFFKEYKAGRTPNPDVMCNKEIKFKLLYDWAMKHGFDYVATGHYAQIEKVVSSQLSVVSKNALKLGLDENRLQTTDYRLLRSADEFKDQTYFIYNIKTEQLPHVLFPIGHLKKTQVRAMAKKIGLPNAEKRESMGLCFVGKIRLKDFLEQKLKPKPGPIVLLVKNDNDEKHKVIGEHQGLHNYTIGQRQGINVGGKGGPYFVVSKDLVKNILYVTNNPNDPKLETKEVVIHSVNWITKSAGFSVKDKRLRIKDSALLGRYRHQGDLVPLSLEQIDKDHYRVIFKKPQKAIASGQSLVLYQKNTCLGGGVIG
jgi:tRNA-uridine 2-sulfurtransferase